MPELKKRVEKWDNVKFLLVFLVVLGHLADYYTNHSGVCRALFMFIYTFHMPAFLFVSGLFSKRSVKEKRYDKIAPFLVLNLFIKAILSLTDGIIYGKVQFSLFDNPGIPWYVLALFVFYLVTILLRKISPVYVLTVSILFACIVGYDYSIGGNFSLSRIIVYYPFFYLGYLCDTEKLTDILSKKSVKLISAVIIIAFAVFIAVKSEDVYWLRPLITGKNPYKNLIYATQFGGLIRLGYYVVCSIVSFAVIALVPNKLPTGIIARFGSRSMQTYAIHFVFVKILYDALHINKLFENIMSTRTWVIIVPLSIIITLICSLKFWQPIFDFIMKPKKIKKQED